MSEIVVINGSAQKDSLNLHIAKFVEAELKEKGAETTLIHLGDEKLPPFEGYDVDYSPRVKEILNLLHNSDGIYFVMPEYHRAIPGVLKNLLDYIDDDEIKINDRPAALVTATIGQWGQWAQMTILGTLRTLHVWLLPDEMYISRARQNVLNTDGTFKDENIKTRLQAQVDRFLKAVELLKPLRD